MGTKIPNLARRCGGWRSFEFPFGFGGERKALFASRHEEEPNENTFFTEMESTDDYDDDKSEAKVELVVGVDGGSQTIVPTLGWLLQLDKLRNYGNSTSFGFLLADKATFSERGNFSGQCPWCR